MIIEGAGSAAELGANRPRMPPAEDCSVVVVDDDANVLDVMERLLEHDGYRVRAFVSPSDALAAIDDAPPTVLVTDKHMPGLDGLELAERALEMDPSIQIIIVTGAGGETAAQAALKLGAADYLIKPVDPTDLSASVRRAIMRRSEEDYHRLVHTWYREELERKSAELERVSLATLSVLVRALEARNEYFVDHSASVAKVAKAIALDQGLSAAEASVIEVGALLHDIGMIAVPDRIVEKPGRLSEEEYATLKFHCQRGADILEPMESLAEPARFVLEHHERWDGSGYPIGLAGTAISRGGLIVGIAEAWCAFTEERPHRAARSRHDAIKVFEEEAGTWFPATLVDALKRTQNL